jgi:hypothetical protein
LGIGALWGFRALESHFMGKKKAKSTVKDIFKSTPTVPTDEFRFAFSVALAAASLATPVENPQNFGINLLEEDGSVTRIAFTDRPANRAMLAIKKHCAGDSEKFKAICIRYMATKSLPFRDPWLITTEDGMVQLHDAIIDAAADFPVNGRGLFNAQAFYQRVAQLAATGKYEDQDQ